MDDPVGVSKSEIIARSLEKDIRKGRITRGERLDSENTLMQRFSVSRNTVRKGLEALARQGLITTRSGIGSFVTYEGAQINDALGWTLALSKAGGEVATRVLGIWRGPCDAAAERTGAANDFLCIDRLRIWTDTGAGISLERSRLPWRDSFAKVLADGLVDGSLSRTLADLQIQVASGREWADVLPRLSDASAEVMGRTPGEPMLHLRRITRDGEGAVIEHVESILDPQRFGLSLEF